MKEFYIFIVLFLFLTLGMHHNEWFSYPIEHLKNLSTAGAYGLGSLHPLIFTLIIYLLYWLPRGLIKLIKRSTKKKA